VIPASSSWALRCSSRGREETSPCTRSIRQHLRASISATTASPMILTGWLRDCSEYASLATSALSKSCQEAWSSGPAESTA
jgi:hypothetical protein